MSAILTSIMTSHIISSDVNRKIKRDETCGSVTFFEMMGCSCSGQREILTVVFTTRFSKPVLNTSAIVPLFHLVVSV